MSGNIDQFPVFLIYFDRYLHVFINVLEIARTNHVCTPEFQVFFNLGDRSQEYILEYNMCLHINVLEIARTKLLFVVLNLRNLLSVGLEIARTLNQTNTPNFHSFQKTRPGDRKDIHPISYPDKCQIFTSF